MHHALSAPLPQDLQHLLSRLQEEAYQQVSNLYDQAGVYITELESQTTGMSAYTEHCARLLREISGYQRLRRLVLLPYIKELLEKEEDGHDCSACGGGCTLSHSSRIREIREAHLGIRNGLTALQAGSIQVAHTPYPESYSRLRAAMAQLQEILLGILFIEESALIPMLTELQQKIRAHG